MRKLLFISVLALLTNACTWKGTYNQLDWIAANYLEGYVSLSDNQEDRLKQRMTDTLQWHRKTQLPVYTKWLQALRYDVYSGSLSPARAEQHSLQLLGYWQNLMARFSADMAAILPDLSAEQREELFESFADKNEDYRDKRIKVSLEERSESYAERLEDQFDRWLGSLKREQKKIIARAARDLYYIAPDSLSARVRWQQELEKVLQQHSDAAITRNAMLQLFTEPKALRSKAYQLKLDHNRVIISRLVSDMAQTLTDKQQKYLFKRIDKYIKMFSELAKETG